MDFRCADDDDRSKSADADLSVRWKMALFVLLMDDELFATPLLLKPITGRLVVESGTFF